MAGVEGAPAGGRHHPGDEGRRRSRAQGVLSPAHLGQGAPTWQLPWVAKDGDRDEEGSGPGAQEANPPGAHPQWALSGQLRPAARDAWGQCCAHSTQSTHTRHPSVCWSVRGRGQRLCPDAAPHPRSGPAVDEGNRKDVGWGCTMVTSWQTLCSQLRSIPSSGACQTASQQGHGDWGLAGGQALPARAGQGTPHSQSSAEGPWLMPWPQRRAWEQLQLVSPSSGRPSIYTVPSPRPHSPSGPQTPWSIRAGSAWTPAQGHHPPATTVALSLWARPQP